MLLVEVQKLLTLYFTLPTASATYIFCPTKTKPEPRRLKEDHLKLLPCAALPQVHYGHIEHCRMNNGRHFEKVNTDE